MTTLYAWNTARAGSVAYPNVREARLFHPTRGRQFFDLGSIHLSPNKKIRPVRTIFQRLGRSLALPDKPYPPESIP
uniref:Uncharacterized protein n=4 Tax=Candidatus Kentrum sp. FM TaxID=2126340 RepID=A0A450VTQ7_9GAMM|nr:MAG: hypothetical protein BECKFM1743C_GA0114222_102153 [Candidatus Kentron sp. FM]VFK08201.1 MAG: hypothetical protein BECKFM1743B_GA0114221_100625 [Candidatus Kentron sp. FM]